MTSNVVPADDGRMTNRRGAFYRQGWTLWVDPYKLFLRPILFRMDAEQAHHLSVWLLRVVPAPVILWLCKHRQVLP
jgi:hypothetical protein